MKAPRRHPQRAARATSEPVGRKPMPSCRRPAALCLALSLLATSLPVAARAQWVHDGAPICTATLDQRFPVAVGDGAGGVIVAWQDDRTGANQWKVYAQRL